MSKSPKQIIEDHKGVLCPEFEFGDRVRLKGGGGFSEEDVAALVVHFLGQHFATDAEKSGLLSYRRKDSWVNAHVHHFAGTPTSSPFSAYVVKHTNKDKALYFACELEFHESSSDTTSTEILELLCEESIFADLWRGRGNVLMVKGQHEYFPTVKDVRVWEAGMSSKMDRYVDASFLKWDDCDDDDVVRLTIGGIHQHAGDFVPGEGLDEAADVVGLTTTGDHQETGSEDHRVVTTPAMVDVSGMGTVKVSLLPGRQSVGLIVGDDVVGMALSSTMSPLGEGTVKMVVERAASLIAHHLVQAHKDLVQ